MQLKSSRRRSGFTLVEIMIVVAIIALLASIAVPSFLRARKRSQATVSLETGKQLNDAWDLYRTENGKSMTVMTQLAPYAKQGSAMYNALAANVPVLDALGRNYPAVGADAMNATMVIHKDTQDALSDVTGDPKAFWGALYNPN